MEVQNRPSREISDSLKLCPEIANMTITLCHDFKNVNCAISTLSEVRNSFIMKCLKKKIRLKFE